MSKNNKEKSWSSLFSRGWSSKEDPVEKRRESESAPASSQGEWEPGCDWGEWSIWGRGHWRGGFRRYCGSKSKTDIPGFVPIGDPDFKVGEFPRHVVDRYGSGYDPDEFLGCKVWLDADADDAEIIAAVAKQVSTVPSHLSGKKVNASCGEKDFDYSSYATISGEEICVSTLPLSDKRFSVIDRVNTVFWFICHESAHVRYTTPAIGALLLKNGHVEKQMTQDGRLVDGPAWEEVKSLFDNYYVAYKLFNVLEDHVVNSSLVRDFPGFAGYYDSALLYYEAVWGWKVNEIVKELHENKALNDQIRAHIVTIKVLLPEMYAELEEKSNSALDKKCIDEIKEFSAAVDETLNARDWKNDLSSRIRTADELSKLFYDTSPLTADYSIGIDVLIREASQQDLIASKINRAIEEQENKKKTREYEELDNVKEFLKSVGNPPMFKGNKTGNLPTIYKNHKDVAKIKMDLFKEAQKQAEEFGKLSTMLQSKYVGVDTLTEQEEGEIDEDELAFVFHGKRDVFEEQTPKLDWSLDICVLIDESGSMASPMKGGKERKINVARYAGLAMYLAYKDCPNITLHLVGHTNYTSGGREGLIVYQYYNGTTGECNIDELFRGNGENCNIDGYAILECGRLLKESKGDSKLLIVISDGRPSGSVWYIGNVALTHNKMAVQQLESNGIDVIQVGIDSTADGSACYTKRVDFHPGMNLGKELTKIIAAKTKVLANAR